MTRWGVILLIGYLVIGLRVVDRGRAVRYAVWLTAVVVGTIMAKNRGL